MKLYAWQFTNEPIFECNSTKSLEQKIESWENFFSNMENVGIYETFNFFYNDGYVRDEKFQFQPIETNRGVDWTEILIHKPNNRGWFSRYIPSVDPEIIKKFIATFETDITQVDWFIKPDNYNSLVNIT